MIRLIEPGLSALAARVPLREAVLFGSCASNRHTIASDVDLLIVYRGPERDDVFDLAKQLIRVPRLEPHVYSASEAEALADVLGRMRRGGVRLYPAEAGA